MLDMGFLCPPALEFIQPNQNQDKTSLLSTARANTQCLDAIQSICIPVNSSVFDDAYSHYMNFVVANLIT